MNKTKATICFSLMVAVLVLASAFVLARTVTITPNAQGNYATWSNTGCGSGSNEWQCVDENPVNTSDYLYTSTASKAESFAFSDMSSPATIDSVTLYYYAKYYNSGKYKMTPLIRASSTDYLGSVMSLGSSYATLSQTYTTNPATGSAWTVSEVNSLEAGMKSYSANAGAYVAQVYAVVSYTMPNSCSDTDGGYYPLTQGTASGYYNGNPYSNSDYCVDSGNVMEYYCSGNYEQSQQQSCGTDGYSPNYCLSGDVYRNSTDYYCASGECDVSITTELVDDCISPEICSRTGWYYCPLS